MIDIKFIDPVSGQAVEIGNLCKRWRIMNNFDLSEVAQATGYTTDNIVKFEQGKNNNMKILLWYLEHGFDVSRFRKAGDKNES